MTSDIDIVLVNDSLGTPRPMRRRDLWRFGLDEDGQPTGPEQEAIPAPAIYKKTTLITSAEILDLQNNPVVLLDPCAAGKYYRVHSYVAKINWVTTPYTTNDANYVQISTTGNTNNLCASLNITENNGTDVIYSGASNNPPLLAGGVDGNGISLTRGSVDTVFTLGDNTISLTLYYSIEDI
jgi:hypothetical protein